MQIVQQHAGSLVVDFLDRLAGSNGALVHRPGAADHRQQRIVAEHCGLA
jgi:hypothetical protein